MAQVSITLKITIDEANLLLMLLDEAEDLRQNLGKMLKEAGREVEAGNIISEEYKKAGQEVLAIQAFRRGIKGANR